MSTDTKNKREVIEDSGELFFDEDTIRYASREFGSWSLPIKSVRVVGEFTNDHGPHLDDYFLVFLSGKPIEQFHASLYAKGRDEFLMKLSAALPGMDGLALSSSTDWKSRVLWPPDLQGKPLFEFCRPVHGAGVVGKIASALDSRIEIRISEHVHGLIRANP